MCTAGITNAFPVEANWCNNNFVGIENAAQRRSAWMTDLLPECPLYQIIQKAWADAKMHFSADCFRQAVGDANIEMAPKFTSNLHWSIRSIDGEVHQIPA